MAQKMNQPNQGIMCEVTNCTYNMNGNQCSADKIQVTPRDAKTKKETDCSTFSAK